MDKNVLNQKLASDEEFVKKLTAADTAEEILAVMKNAGFDVTSEELDDVLSSLEIKESKGSSEELSDDDLDEVVGGRSLNIVNVNVFNNDIISRMRKLLKKTPEKKKSLDKRFFSGGNDEIFYC